MDYLTKSIMGQQLDTYNQKAIEILEDLIEQERTVLEKHRRHVTQTADPRLKWLIIKLTKNHEQGFNELDTFLTQIRSENEVTRQINDMFL